MKSALSFVSALTLLGLTSAQGQPEYAQCGGIGWTGGTTCVSPYVCVVQNPYYSQCIAGTGATTTTTTHTTTTSTHTTTTTTHTATSTTSTKSTTTTSSSVITAPTGFVSVSSSPSPHFVLGGKPFYFGGTNAYYIPQLDAAADMQSVFQTMNSLGLTVVRVWAFNEVTATQNYGAYYQLWNGATPTINLGPNGFDRLDSTLQLAGQYGVKVILTLTNNWSDFGGSDVYVRQILGSSATHDQFYSNSQVISVFKNYVKFVVQRYASNSNVFSWELMNEPRCGGSTGSPSSACNSALITSWVSNISAYIKSLDSNHLVTVGDEGFFCWTNTTDYIYDCGTGGDSNSYSKISSIDWLTFHMYPEGWGETSPSLTAWGQTWITQHAYVQQASGKPAVLEEFGIGEGDATKATTYSAWYSTVQQYKLGGAMYWQLGNADSAVTAYTQSDGNTVFCPSYTATCPVIQANAKAMAGLTP